MQRVAVIANLKPDMAERARELVASGPPFDPDELGFERHHVYVSEGQVVFAFETAPDAPTDVARGPGDEYTHDRPLRA